VLGGREEAVALAEHEEVFLVTGDRFFARVLLATEDVASVGREFG